MNLLGGDYTLHLKGIFPENVLAILREYKPTKTDFQLMSLNAQFRAMHNPLTPNLVLYAKLYVDHVRFLFTLSNIGHLQVETYYLPNGFGDRALSLPDIPHVLIQVPQRNGAEVAEMTLSQAEFRQVINTLGQTCMFCMESTEGYPGVCPDCAGCWHTAGCRICGEHVGLLSTQKCCNYHMRCWFARFQNEVVEHKRKHCEICREPFRKRRK